MAKQLGRAMIITIDDGSGTQINLCGLNAKSISINTNAIDATTPDCTTPGGILWRESLAGMKSIDISGDGIFEDSAAEIQLNTIAMAADNSTAMTVIVPDLGTYAGTFRATLEYTGETGSTLTFTGSFESTGAVTFTAA